MTAEEIAALIAQQGYSAEQMGFAPVDPLANVDAVTGADAKQPVSLATSEQAEPANQGILDYATDAVKSIPQGLDYVVDKGMEAIDSNKITSGLFNTGGFLLQGALGEAFPNTYGKKLAAEHGADVDSAAAQATANNLRLQQQNAPQPQPMGPIVPQQPTLDTQHPTGAPQAPPTLLSETVPQVPIQEVGPTQAPLANRVQEQMEQQSPQQVPNTNYSRFDSPFNTTPKTLTGPTNSGDPYSKERLFESGDPFLRDQGKTAITTEQKNYGRTLASEALETRGGADGTANMRDMAALQKMPEGADKELFKQMLVRSKMMNLGTTFQDDLNKNNTYKIDHRGKQMQTKQADKDIEFIDKRESRAVQQDAAISHAYQLSTDIEDLKRYVDWRSTGMIGMAMANVYGSRAESVKNRIENLEAQMSVEGLQEMSKAANMGTISEGEMRMAAGLIAQLGQSNSNHEIIRNLVRIQDYLNTKIGDAERGKAQDQLRVTQIGTDTSIEERITQKPIPKPAVSDRFTDDKASRLQQLRNKRR